MGRDPRLLSRTRSADEIPDALAMAVGSGRGKRDMRGCLTCRVRRKKCTGPTSDDGFSCGPCRRNAIDCLGYPGPSPPWAGRSQRRLRECALRSKLWIELTKGRTDGSVLDLSYYKQPDVPVELSPEDIENLYALEWQAHLHAFGEDEIDTEKERRARPQCPRPAFCTGRLMLPELRERGLLQVLGYQEFSQYEYVPRADRSKKAPVALPTRNASGSPGPSSRRSESVPLRLVSESQPLSHSDAVEVSAYTPVPSSYETAVAESSTRFNARGTRLLPPPTRQSLTDSVVTPVSGFVRRRDALPYHPSPSLLREHNSRSTSPWGHNYQDAPISRPSSAGPRNETRFDDPLYSVSPYDAVRGQPRRSATYPHPVASQSHSQSIRQDYRTLPHPLQPPPFPPLDLSSGTLGVPPDSRRSASPGAYLYSSSEHSSFSSSPSPSEDRSEHTQTHQFYRPPPARDPYALGPLPEADRQWSSSNRANTQFRDPFNQSHPQFSAGNFGNVEIAPHERVPTSAMPASSHVPPPFPTSSPRPPRDNRSRSPSPRPGRLMSFQLFGPSDQTQ